MKNLNATDIRKIVRKSIAIILPMLFVVGFVYNYLSHSEIEKTKEILMEGQEQRSKIVQYIIENSLHEAYENLMVVTNSNEVATYLENTTAQNKTEVEHLFLRIAANKKNFDQIRFIDAAGSERIRVNQLPAGPALVASDDLQNVSNRYYYIQASKLQNHEVFISDMDLNMEDSAIEVPYKPTIRMCIPVYASDGAYQGVIAINYLAQEILDALSQQYVDSMYRFIKPALINQDGYYLFNLDGIPNFGFMFPDESATQVADFDADLWHNITIQGTGFYEKDSEVTFFSQVHPLAKLNIPAENCYSWYIVSTLNLSELPVIKNQLLLGLRSRDVIMLLGLIISIIAFSNLSYFSAKDREELNILQKIAENSHDAVVITDAQTNIIYINKAFELTTGYSREEVLGLRTSYFKSGKQSKDFYKSMWDAINTNGYWNGELWDKKKNGFLYPKKLSIYALKDQTNKKVIKYMGIFNDLTDFKENQNYINKLKNYNLKTNLPNENLTSSLINNIIKNASANFNLIYFTIENYNNLLLKFKEDDFFINPLIGSVKSILKEEDFIAQITKNDFIIGVSSCATDDEMLSFVRTLFSETGKPFSILTEKVFLDLSAGISTFPKNGTSANELINHAYIALDNALHAKETKYLYYSPDLKDHMETEIKMDMLLRRAIENHELQIYYQPQMDINQEVIVGAEALLRWNSAELGSVSPAVFIPLAEKNGLIIEIGYWIIETIFQDYLSLQEKMDKNFRISINISPLQFRDKDLIDKIKELGQTYQVNFENFEIEITESSFVADLDDINQTFAAFKEIGLTIAIDDFGTGFSSLSYLRELTIDKLKIDRSFIKDYPVSDNGAIVELITNISNKLNLKVITEGAETTEQIDYLKSIGCNLVQGFYYSKPLPKELFTAFLEQHGTQKSNEHS